MDGWHLMLSLTAVTGWALFLAAQWSLWRQASQVEAVLDRQLEAVLGDVKHTVNKELANKEPTHAEVNAILAEIERAYTRHVSE